MPWIIAILSLAILVNLGNNLLQSTTFEVKSARLPASFDGYCIVQISDLHSHQFGKNHSRLVKAVREARPDLIAITGDLTNQGMWDAEYIGGLVRRLQDIAPVYFVTGNHEYYTRDLPKLLTLLESAGVLVLDDTSMVIARGSESITIAGIRDPQMYSRRSGGKDSTIQWKSSLATLRATIESEKYTLLLSHRPEFIEEYGRLGFDLVLSGHAHGGQVRLPIIGPLYAHGQGRFPKYTSGIYRRGETVLVVSRGLGNSGFPVRVLNRPELVIVRLRSLHP